MWCRARSSHQTGKRSSRRTMDCSPPALGPGELARDYEGQGPAERQGFGTAEIDNLLSPAWAASGPSRREPPHTPQVPSLQQAFASFHNLQQFITPPNHAATPPVRTCPRLEATAAGRQRGGGVGGIQNREALAVPARLPWHGATGRIRAVRLLIVLVLAVVAVGATALARGDTPFVADVAAVDEFAGGRSGQGVHCRSEWGGGGARSRRTRTVRGR